MVRYIHIIYMFPMIDYDEKPITYKTLEGYMDKVAYPRVREIIREEVGRDTDKILTSNDRLANKLDRILTEQQAITVNYKRVDQRVEYLESFSAQVAQKLGLVFERV